MLTAAHCVNKRDRKPSSVRMGKVTLFSADDELEEQDIEIKKVYIHPRYTSRKKYNDIALIELVKAASYSFTVNPACLYSKTDDITQKLVVCGWGVMNTKTKAKSADLLKASLDYLPIDKCNKEFQEFSWYAEELPQGLNSSQLCAIDPINRADTCQVCLSPTFKNVFKLFVFF